MEQEERDQLLMQMDNNLQCILQKSLKLDDAEDAALARDVVNFFQAQFNSETVEGHINDLQFRPILYDIIMCLHELIYIKHHSYELASRDVLMGECRSLAIFMLSKIYNGRFYFLRELDIRSRQQVNNFLGGPAHG